MISFDKQLDLCDREWYTNWFNTIGKAEAGLCSFYNFTNLYLWNEAYDQRYETIGERMIFLFVEDGTTYYSFPVGRGDIKNCVIEFKEYIESIGKPLVFIDVSEKETALLESVFPGKFSFVPNIAGDEYIYLAESLSSFFGKALHSKKNHCNNFEKAHPGWEFIPISSSNISKCKDMAKAWYQENRDRVDSSISDEEGALYKALDDYDALELEGGMLIHNGEVLGFSIGGVYTDDCFDCHFEKADINVNGAYPMVCREMTKMVMKNHPGVIYINREDDMGIESMRKSKESYHPIMMLKKYHAKWIY